MSQSNQALEDENSARTRVTPVFTWLRDNGGDGWAKSSCGWADGISVCNDIGPIQTPDVGEERLVAPSPARLA